MIIEVKGIWEDRPCTTNPEKICVCWNTGVCKRITNN